MPGPVYAEASTGYRSPGRRSFSEGGKPRRDERVGVAFIREHGSTITRHAPRMRGIQYAAASRFNHGCSGILDHPPPRMMTAEGKARARSTKAWHSRHCTQGLDP